MKNLAIKWIRVVLPLPPRRSNQRHGQARFEGEAEIVQDRPMRPVREGDMVQFDPALRDRGTALGRRLRPVRRRIEKAEKPLRAGHGG